MCQASSPHMDAICPAEPGDDCDPICQSRCDCGRCNLVGTLLTCTPAGSKQTGDVCNVGMDDCSAGNICLKDCDGKTTRCYRFCSTTSAANEAVCGGQMCDVPVNDMNNNFTGIQVCDPPQRSCNPVGDSGDCGDPALGCYITSAGVTVCDCRGTAGANGDCGTYNSCITGYRCVSLMGATKCFKTCVFGGSDCTAPAVCKQAPGSPTYGYCDLP
jgi:hypothetical protein